MKKIISKDTYIEGSNTTLEKLVGKILWTNPNPSDSMGPVDINLSTPSSDYDEIECIYNMYGGSSNILCSCKGLKRYSLNMASVGFPSLGVGAWYREIQYVNDSKYHLGNCRYFNTSDNKVANNMNIPLYIIGRKTGLF